MDTDITYWSSILTTQVLNITIWWTPTMFDDYNITITTVITIIVTVENVLLQSWTILSNLFNYFEVFFAIPQDPLPRFIYT